jgi:uncharacterized membrane protein
MSLANPVLGCIGVARIRTVIGIHHVVPFGPDHLIVFCPCREGAHLLVDRHAKDGEVLQGLAVIAKDDNQRLSLKEIVHEHASGTAVGAFIGALAGFPAGGPVAAAIGATAGALFGLSADLINRGGSKALLEKVSRGLLPGKAAIIAEVSDDRVSAFETEIVSVGGAIVRTAK